MIGSVVRRLVVPLLVAGTVLVALPRVTPTPAAVSPTAEAPLSEDPVAAGVMAEQAQALLDLWAGWGPDLMSTESPEAPAVPAEVQALPFEETVYVLASVRVAQLAAAERTRRAEGSATSDGRALEREPAAVTTAAPDSVASCVSLDVTHEPYGRTFYGLIEPSDARTAGTSSALEDTLVRSVRVGFRALHDATCGDGAVAFSPEAQRALASLSPELLEH